MLTDNLLSGNSTQTINKHPECDFTKFCLLTFIHLLQQLREALLFIKQSCDVTKLERMKFFDVRVIKLIRTSSALLN